MPPPEHVHGLQALADEVRTYAGLDHKRDIQATLRALGQALPAAQDHPAGWLAVGDDCAALPDGDGFLLLAIEGFLSEFVAAEPWFAGWCGLMVNLSDIAAMGGRALAVVDAVWSRADGGAAAIMEGLRAAALAYGVPVVGGHSNTHAGSEQLAVAVLGRARRLLTSFDARAGDTLLMVVDLRGRWHEPYPFFDAATGTPPARLRADLELLPALAESGRCRAGKDISMAGIVGTAAMLLESSGLGACIDLARLPRPTGLSEAELPRWLRVFPSYGYVLAVAPEHVAEVSEHFTARGLSCASIAVCDDSRQVRLGLAAEEALVWDLRTQPLTGCTRAARD